MRFQVLTVVFLILTPMFADSRPVSAESPRESPQKAPRASQAPPQTLQPTAEQKFFDWTELQFAKEVYAERRGRLATALRATGEGVFLTPSRPGRSHGETFRQADDFFYFCGLELPDSILAVESTSGRTILFVPDRDARFHSDSRSNDFPGRPLGEDPEIAQRSGISEIRSIDDLDEAIRAWAEAGWIFRLQPGYRGEIRSPEPAIFTRRTAGERLVAYLEAAHPAARLRSAYDEVARLRLVKSSEEVAQIRRAVDATAESIRRAAREVRAGVTERALAGEFEVECKRRGAPRLAFDSIIKSGPNSLWPWRILAAQYERRDRLMEDGDLVIFDVGCEIGHYASDIGRTFPVSGKFSPEQVKTLQMVTKVTDEIIAAVRPGVSFAQLKEVAIAAIPESERRYMQTGLFFGHHIGLGVGDPNLAEIPLAPGMIFTVEPWYYNHDREIAVFLEENVLVTAEGHENLSRDLARTPGDLERLMGRRAPAIEEIDAVVASPGQFKVLLENEHVRVLEYVLQPGERDAWHTHPPKVSYIVSAGTLRIVTDDGRVFLSEEEVGNAHWRGASGRHYAENVGETPVRVLLVEVKVIRNVVD